MVTFSKVAPNFFKKHFNTVSLSFFGALIFIILSIIVVLAALWKIFSVIESDNQLSKILETAIDSEYHRTIVRTLTYAILAVILKLLIALPLALLLRRFPFRFINNLFLIPWVLPSAVSALAWIWLFYDINGGANILLKFIGFSEISWLGKGNLAFGICLLFNVWREVPLWAWVIAPSFSGLQGGVSMLAEQDGLTDWEKYRLIVFPKVRPILIALAILSMIWSFGEFEATWILTRGGPGESTELLSLYAYRHAFMAQNIARGAAAFLCFLPISIMILTILIMIYQWAAKRARI
jgi:multiple sugar transport system permease protein